MQRYFVKEKNNEKFILEDSDIHHIKRVMRCKDNDKIEVVYNKKVYLCNIDNIDSNDIVIILHNILIKNNIKKLIVDLRSSRPFDFEMVIEYLKDSELD